MGDETNRAKKGRGSGRKAAPPGFYTASEAAHKLGLERYQFYRNVGDRGLKITRVVPPGYSEGYYQKKEIDALVALQEATATKIRQGKAAPPITFRTAQLEDAQGIVDILKSLGWPTTTPQQRRERMRVNPEMDHITVQHEDHKEIVVAYINAVPYKDPYMEWMAAGHTPDGQVFKSWHVQPDYIYPFEPGHEYDLFVGLAERDPEHQSARHGLRLILGFRDVMFAWLKRGIRIRRLIAHTSEPDGLKLANALGFEFIAVAGDKHPRYVLDLRTTEWPFWQGYCHAAFPTRSGEAPSS
jgi:hypothetical protein